MHFVATAKKSSNTKKLVADLVQSGLPESPATEAFAKELIAKVGGGKPKASQKSDLPFGDPSCVTCYSKKDSEKKKKKVFMDGIDYAI